MQTENNFFLRFFVNTQKADQIELYIYRNTLITISIIANYYVES